MKPITALELHLIGLSKTELDEYSKFSTEALDTIRKYQQTNANLIQRGRVVAVERISKFCKTYGKSNGAHFKRDRNYTVRIYINHADRTYSTTDTSKPTTYQLCCDYNQRTIWIDRRANGYVINTCYYLGHNDWTLLDVQDIVQVLTDYKLC